MRSGSLLLVTGLALLAGCHRPPLLDSSCYEKRRWGGWCLAGHPEELLIETPTGRSRLEVSRVTRDAPWWVVRGRPGRFLARFTSDPPAPLELNRLRMGSGPATHPLCVSLCFGPECASAEVPDWGVLPHGYNLQAYSEKVPDLHWIELSWEPAPASLPAVTGSLPCPETSKEGGP